jgi:hypothetical protein
VVNESWHAEFNPKKFLGRVNLDQLIERNEAHNENRTDDAKSPCGASPGSGIVLNNLSFLCRQCFERVATISYPERYEIRWREYLTTKESRRLARADFVARHGYTLNESPLVVLGCVSGLAAFVYPWILILAAVLFALGNLHNAASKRRLRRWLALLTEWEAENLEPVEPELFHFHDSRAELSENDRAVLRIFNHWPGYPPFWKYLRAVVLAKDSNRCQVTGCPSRLDLHVHHMQSVSNGGEHKPDNLVSLCDFHHALEPERGHKRIWGDIKTRYFTLVCSHERNNRASPGTHGVKAHLRRLSLISAVEIAQLKETYGFACPHCRSTAIEIRILGDRNALRVECPGCLKSTEGPQQLTEETGPMLAEVLAVCRNQGRWKARWDMLSERRSATWGNWSSRTAIAKRGRFKRGVETTKLAPTCSDCGSAMRLVRPRAGDRWKTFWGCTNYKITGCRGSARYADRSG